MHQNLKIGDPRLSSRVRGDQSGEILKMGIDLSYGGIGWCKVIERSVINDKSLPELSIFKQRVDFSQLLYHAVTVTKPLLIPDLHRKLMSLGNSVYCQKNEKYQKARNHTGTRTAPKEGIRLTNPLMMPRK